MKVEPLVARARPAETEAEGRHWLRFAVLLALALLAAGLLAKPKHIGDFPEYGLMTVAIASHASPDIRLSDIEAARVLLPDWTGAFVTVADGMHANAQVPVPGFFLGDDGKYYAIHYFAYSALAAVPYKLLQWLGLDPFRCFQVVNLASAFVLGLALFRLFGTGRRAALGVLAFLLCGGVLYWQWSSPECMSAAVLLAGLVLFATGAPLAGGLLAGLAAMQNPPVVLFCAFAPLLRLCVQDRAGPGIGLAFRQLLQPRYLTGLALTALLFVQPILYNLRLFHTPSIIARGATSPELINLNRLHAFFFDLNQGLLVGVPVVVLALAAWAWTRQARALALCATAGAFSVAMAVPALAAQNWNSAAAGIMRYAMWASMPLLFAFLWRLRLAPRWPAALVAVVLAGQALAMANARRYSALEFSPLAMRVIERAPGLYNPDPEIFYERLEHRERYPERERAYTYLANGVPVKTLYHTAGQSLGAQLCGPNAQLAPGHAYVDAGFGWRYLNGPPPCVSAAR